MTPISFLLEHRHEILNTYTGSPVETWGKLAEVIQIDGAMSENTFRALIKNFVETCQFYERLNNELNNEIQRLNNEINNKRGPKMETEAVKSRLNISGWTVAKSGRYYRAFKKIDGKLHGVHLGSNLHGAGVKIKAKMAAITSGEQGAPES